ncbi:hypothetical protein CYMTET_30367 [Cymbomonas tetramitiformis]|uniref:Non-canonical E2 ubiquitin-conjugating enzyme C-terminal domain-containing protein n=1 Tax=Cymbomonas tetramitiformis TaxID=36881 RepID=A0AAE0KU79_9CHLO|nr:hypothetical protein CYMTET_30367 [Cymbomonas tetramitiformis]
MIRAFSSCLARGALGIDSVSHGPRNEALSEVLDGPQNVEMGTGQDARQGEAKNFEGDEMARSNAEASLEDKSRRLAVAQEQLAEYAEAKYVELKAFGQPATKLCQAVAGGSGSFPQVVMLAQDLQQKLEEAEKEADAFAKQARKDVDYLKAVRITVRQTSQEPEEEPAPLGALSADGDEDGIEVETEMLDSPNRPLAPAAFNTELSQRARWIPLRLQIDERKSLRLLEAALNVSEYTDKVDILTFRNKTQRMHTQLKDMCAILSGLLVASDYKKGQKLMAHRSFLDNAEFFQNVFEVGRRHKVMNPDKMRADYGKLIYLLMDSQVKFPL